MNSNITSERDNSSVMNIPHNNNLQMGVKNGEHGHGLGVSSTTSFNNTMIFNEDLKQSQEIKNG